MSGVRWRRHGASATAAVAVLLVYLAVFVRLPQRVFWSPDEGGKFLELHSLHSHGGQPYTVPYAGQRIDPGFQFYPRYHATFPYPTRDVDGTIRFHWPIWFPLLSRLMLHAFGLS